MSQSPNQQIQDVGFTDALSERYIAYALSTIVSRSLPDVRDGLKPVHRRLLYAMLCLKLDPSTGFKKCARVVGDVIGKFHPHGEVAVYDTLVRLAQYFAVRYPLIEGQGNFGSIDGDNAAAMRYTEARLTDVAMALMQDIRQGTVDFTPNYDGSEDEPALMPAAVPNLLANGTEGIAVGMATSVPPHNMGELCEALLRMIKKPSISITELMDTIQGPDLPTGGWLIDDKASMIQMYETGRGSFRVRARWEKEDLSHGMYQIVITEIPYHVQKSRLLERVVECFKNKRLAMVGNIKDESADDIRIIIEPKNRTIDPEMLMESLYKLTELEVRLGLNMNVLDKNTIPRVMNLKEVLEAFLEHRMEVLTRRLNFRLEQINHRLEILDGLLIIYLNLDELLRILRYEDEPKPLMMKKWALTEIQTEAILNTRLRSLRKLEEEQIKSEHNRLSEEKATIVAALDEENVRWKMIADELKVVRNSFGEKTPLGRRRTEIVKAPSVNVVSIEAFVEKEPITILCSKKGWIRAMRGHIKELQDIKYKDADAENFVIYGQTTDKLLVFTTDGKCYTLQCDKLPKGKGFGEPVRLMLEMGAEADLVNLMIYKSDQSLMIASSAGYGFAAPSEDMLASTKTGKQVLNLLPKESAICCSYLEGDRVAVIGSNRKLLIFNADELPSMKRGKGVRLQKYKDAQLSDITSFKSEEGMTWKLGDRTRAELNMDFWLGKRGGVGKMPPSGFPRSNKFS